MVNNTPELPDHPAGRRRGHPDGRRQRYLHDFFNYAGLHRSVWLYATPPRPPRRRHRDHRPGRRHRRGRLPGRGRGGRRARRRVVLRDADGTEVAAGTGADGTLDGPAVHRWAPGDGYLYDLEVQLVDGDDVVDSYHQSVGVRTVAVDGDPVPDQRRTVLLHRASASTRTSPVIGKGHNDALPGARLRAAQVDRRQLLPHLALPVRRGRPGLRRPAGPRADRRDGRGRPEHGPRRRHLRRPGLHRPSPPRRSTTPPRRCTRRPSASWSPGTRTTPASCCGASPTSRSPTPRRAEDYFRPLFDVAREADPTRPVGFVNVMLAPARDVPRLPVRRRADAQPLLRLVRRHRRPGRGRARAGGRAARLGGDGKPIIITEYGADTYPGLHSVTAGSRGPRSTRWSTST